MFGKTGAEYARFERWILILIVLVFALRLGMSLSGVPNVVTKWVSINLVLLVGLVYCGVAVHTARFGQSKLSFRLFSTFGFSNAGLSDFKFSYLAPALQLFLHVGHELVGDGAVDDAVIER